MFGAIYQKATLHHAVLSGTKFYQADLSQADLRETHFEAINLPGGTNIGGGAYILDALSLTRTDLRLATGLTKEALTACKAMGAIVDEDYLTKASPVSSTVTAAPSQGDDMQNSSHDVQYVPKVIDYLAILAQNGGETR